MTKKPQVLAISSFVGYDIVGLRAIGPALSALSCEAIEIPTVVLSNHPGHAHTAGERLAPSIMIAMAQALLANRWFANLSAVLTGYLPSREHVCSAAACVRHARTEAPSVPFVLDPILGDDPKGLYVDETVAHAMRTELLPLADVVTPNRFELAWLSGRRIAGPADAIVAARMLAVPAVVATSVPETHSRLATLLVTRDDAVVLSTPERAGVPHGTGDLLAGLLTAHIARGAGLGDALRQSHAMLEIVIAKSGGRARLDLSALTNCAWVP